MKRKVLVLMTCLLLSAPAAVMAQCSICTKTTQQLGEKPARGMNTGILYLAFTPLLIIGVIAWRWKKSNLVP